MENKLETTGLLKGIYWGYIRIMEKEMEITIRLKGIYWDYIGIIDNRIETINPKP